MSLTIKRKNVWFGLFLLVTTFGVLSSWLGAPIVPFGICGYLLLVFVPGAALYLLVSKEPDILECLIAATAISPVLTTSVGAVGMLSGIPDRGVAVLLVVLAGTLGVLAVSFGRPPVDRLRLTRRQAFALIALLVVVSAAISYLPFTRDWWRMRSDAWFHGAVVAQIRDFGIPPEDPYAVGLPLQYMWFYHVYVVILSRVSGIGPFMIMALINLHALVAFGVASFLFSAIFKRTFAHNYAATLTAVFGMNAAFWFFIPFKLFRSFTGQVRGMDEVKRILSLHPFDATTARDFVSVGFNHQFLLDKFMVATAFSLGLCLMAVFWYAAIKYVAQEKRETLIVASLAAFGAVAFHTVIGTVVFGGVLGGLFLLIVFRRSLGDYSTRPLAKLFVALAVCGVLLLPYLYSVNHAKTGGQAVPLGFSVWKMIGIVGTCAFVIFLAAFQARRVLRTKDTATYFFLFTTAAVVGICTLLNLPGSNSYDKLPFPVFYPLAIVGGWTLADFSERARTPHARRLRYILACLAAFAPLNLLMLAAYYNTSPVARLDENEKEVAAWARANTPRDSIILDTSQKGFLLVAGPRRYYLANQQYAEAWGYDRAELAKRQRVINDVYSSSPLETLALETLGTMPSRVYAIVRKDDQTVDSSKFDNHPELFERVCSIGPIAVFEVERSACLSLARKSQRTR